MNKKSFIFTTLVTALLIFSILPISNYIADPSRVLHHDYKMRYLKFHPHKLFLKVAYLIDNKTKYDTLVYGSSRGGFMDVSLISKDAYNMSHGFGTVTTYLHSLKSLLSNEVKVKNVWIGINDFVIWKDHTDNLGRLIYHNNFLQDFEMYSHWLFRLIPESIKILKEHLPLIDTQEVINTQERIPRARQQERAIKGSKRNIPAATLGYTGIYRVDEAVAEIKEIKDLCESHNINLTIFMYPIFYKTYLDYEQSKIEEFKIKLASVVNFYDFYDLSKLSTNQDNWFEGSHFVPSVGDYMIKNIKEHHHLITKENVNERITQTRLYVKNMPIVSSSGLYTLDNRTELHTNSQDIIFNIYDKNTTYYKNNHFSLHKNNLSIEAIVNNIDPMFILDKTKTKSKHTLLVFSMKSDKETLFQLYLKDKENSTYSEGNRYNMFIKKGMNTFKIVIPSQYINHALRVDISKNKGTYTIKKFMIYELH